MTIQTMLMQLSPPLGGALVVVTKHQSAPFFEQVLLVRGVDHIAACEASLFFFALVVVTKH